MTPPQMMNPIDFGTQCKLVSISISLCKYVKFYIQQKIQKDQEETQCCPQQTMEAIPFYQEFESMPLYLILSQFIVCLPPSHASLLDSQKVTKSAVGTWDLKCIYNLQLNDKLNVNLGAVLLAFSYVILMRSNDPWLRLEDLE